MDNPEAAREEYLSFLQGLYGNEVVQPALPESETELEELIRGVMKAKVVPDRDSDQDFHFDPGTATVYTHAARIPRLSALNPAHQLRRQAPKPVRPLTDVDGTG